MKNLPAPTAKNINEAHRLARSTAESAVQYAIQCGQLLAAKKEELKHGEFQAWIEKHCDFAYSTASRYMKAAQNSTAVEISTLSRLFPSGHQPGAKPKSDSPQRAVSVVNPEGGRTTVAKEVDDGPPVARPDITSDRWVPDADEDEMLARAEREYVDSIDKVMESDDRLAAAQAEIKRQAAEIAALKISRDGYMNGKLGITKMLKVEQRKTERAVKQLEDARAELDKLRERIAIMEAA